MNEDFGWSGDEFLMGDCMDDKLDFEPVPEDLELDDDSLWDDCPLDGDAGSALASVGWGTDEDYGDFGDDPYDGGE